MNLALFIIGSLFAVFIVYTYFNMRRLKNMPPVTNHEKIKVLTESNFDHQTKNGLVLVDFWADWCMPCKMMAPVLNELADELDDNKSVGKLDVEKFQSLAGKYNVRSIPTLILFKDGKEINRFVGVKSKDFLLKQLKQA